MMHARAAARLEAEIAEAGRRNGQSYQPGFSLPDLSGLGRPSARFVRAASNYVPALAGTAAMIGTGLAGAPAVAFLGAAAAGFAAGMGARSVIRRSSLAQIPRGPGANMS